MVRAPSKTVIALVLAAALVVFFAVWGVAQGLSNPDVPEGAVAIVDDAPDGTITQEEFDRALEQVAARQGIRQPPEPGDQQYDLFKEQALGDAILSRWVAGEAEELGISVSEEEAQQRLQQIKQQQFDSEKQFQRFLEQSGFSEEDALDRVRLQVLSERIQERVLTGAEDVEQSTVEAFYEENLAQFEQPEARDVRVIRNQDRGKVEEAAEALGDDPSPDQWKEAAREFSTDQATKGKGGLREGVVEGQNEEAFDQAVFEAPEGELVGPFQVGSDWYLTQVEGITEAETVPLEDAQEQIRQQLAGGQQQEAAQVFEAAFVDKWAARTFCAEGFVIERCANAPAPPSPPGAPPVIATRPAAPGTAGSVTPGVSQGPPQTPFPPAQPEQEGLPPGAAPIGPPGAPPPGAPPQAPPPGAPPPGGAAPPPQP